jgi:uncharacterized protein (DUF1778 family)
MSADVLIMPEKTRPVRLTQDAMDLARIAASYRRETMSDYVCRVVIEAARRDIEQGHANLTQAKPKPKGKG